MFGAAAGVRDAPNCGIEPNCRGDPNDGGEPNVPEANVGKLKPDDGAPKVGKVGGLAPKPNDVDPDDEPKLKELGTAGVWISNLCTLFWLGSMAGADEPPKLMTEGDDTVNEFCVTVAAGTELAPKAKMEDAVVDGLPRTELVCPNPVIG
jgi:hypothetical protein